MEHHDTMQGLPLAMAYVPWQSWQNVSDGARGLEQGTIFEELIFPFEYAGPGCRNTCSCRKSGFPTNMAVNSFGPNCRQNPRQKNCLTPYQNRRYASPNMQRQRREDCSCQELTKRN